MRAAGDDQRRAGEARLLLLAHHLAALGGETQALATLAIERLYLRLFDVDWSDGRGGPGRWFAGRGGRRHPRVEIEIVPVVFVRERLLRRLDAPGVARLADDVWRAVYGSLGRLGRRTYQVPQVKELQVDCDWTDTTRARYFDFLSALGERARATGTLLSATIRLHQIKYRERTGVPPVARGMLMFYNMGRIDADDATSAIYDPAAAARYLGRLADYPLPLDVGLPIWSWVVHVRGNEVAGLFQDMDPSRLDDKPWLRSVSARRFEVHCVGVPPRHPAARGGLPRRRADDGGDDARRGRNRRRAFAGCAPPVPWRSSTCRSATSQTMTPRTWLVCSLIFASALAVAPRARACGGGGEDYGAAERTTFDPAVHRRSVRGPRLFYDPQTASVGSGSRTPCAADEMRDDWRWRCWAQA